jgi:hypothetical protein
LLRPIRPSPLILDAPSGFYHHLAELLRLETGTTQHRLHHLVREQIFEAWLIAAAFDAPIHDPLLTCQVVGRIDAKRDRFMSINRRFHGRV